MPATCTRRSFRTGVPSTACSVAEWTPTGQLLLVSKSAPTKVLGKLAAPVDGLAMGPDGTVFISTRTGVFKWARLGEMGIVALGVHGHLVERAESLFVLDRGRNRLVVLRRRGRTA